jgi:hypothetical protein
VQKNCKRGLSGSALRRRFPPERDKIIPFPTALDKSGFAMPNNSSSPATEVGERFLRRKIPEDESAVVREHLSHGSELAHGLTVEDPLVNGMKAAPQAGAELPRGHLVQDVNERLCRLPPAAWLKDRGGRCCTQGMTVFTAGGQMLGWGGGYQAAPNIKMLKDALRNYKPEEKLAIADPAAAVDAKELPAGWLPFLPRVVSGMCNIRFPCAP